jgi:hypothetical protein
VRRVFFFIAITILTLSAQAQSRAPVLHQLDDPRGLPELTVCSQNLENYGRLADVKRRMKGFDQGRLDEKERALAKRIVRAKCDVVALQELIGKDKERAEEGVQALLQTIRGMSNRIFEYRIAPSNDRRLRLAFLVAKDRAEILSTLSYSRVVLPKIAEKQKPREFARGPYEIQLQVKSRGESRSKRVTLVTFHFKSRRSLKADPTALEWETYRMEMAEALRRIVENRHNDTFRTGESILVLLGDRNSNFDTASARLLQGTLTLKHFQEGICRLSSRGVPLCQGGNTRPQVLFSAFESDKNFFGMRGTYTYKKVYSWLDDILLPAESLRYGWSGYATEGDFAAGVVSAYGEASDHSLVYLRLNW